MPRWEYLAAEAERAVEQVRRRLPRELRPHAAALPVLLEARPAPGDELGPHALGVFEGAPLDRGDHHLPPRIRLWLENLWEFAGGSSAAYRDEVATTYLHELGHYLGLGEDDLIARGLE